MVRCNNKTKTDICESQTSVHSVNTRPGVKNPSPSISFYCHMKDFEAAIIIAGDVSPTNRMASEIDQ